MNKIRSTTDKLARDIRARKKDMTWLNLRNLLFLPLLRLRSISPEFEEEWLTLIFDVPNRPITNYLVMEDFVIRGTYVRVPRANVTPAPRSYKVLANSCLTIRIDQRKEDVIDIEVDACPGDATLLSRWFRVDPSEHARIMNFIKEQ